MSATDTYHHGDLRRALLDTALVLIGKKGVAGLSLREVAAGVGVSHAAPYHHFADKTALIHALGNEGMELLDAHMASAEKAAGDDPRARLLGIGMAYVAFAVQHPEYYATFSSPEMQTPPSAKEAAASDRTPGGTWVRLFNAVLACQASGDLPAGDPMVLAVYLWSLVHGLAELWRAGPLEQLPQASEGLEALAIQVLNAALGAMHTTEGSQG
ncbi:MAG: TetR/AcrR family transcriptional regulator [Actinobacteria bacterium]|nr:TetR/AcrR family transcriptional regulator [Actinomycetota bacterium]MCG2807898.1 TetR/AcrR family transcriptional regulator [Coriobacteriia bacterium]